MERPKSRSEKDSFNPRSHVGSDCALDIDDVDFEKFQSTLPRRERRHPREDPRLDCAVSIHAPT